MLAAWRCACIPWPALPGSIRQWKSREQKGERDADEEISKQIRLLDLSFCFSSATPATRLFRDFRTMRSSPRTPYPFAPPLNLRGMPGFGVSAHVSQGCSDKRRLPCRILGFWTGNSFYAVTSDRERQALAVGARISPHIETYFARPALSHPYRRELSQRFPAIALNRASNP